MTVILLYECLVCQKYMILLFRHTVLMKEQFWCYFRLTSCCSLFRWSRTSMYKLVLQVIVQSNRDLTCCRWCSLLHARMRASSYCIQYSYVSLLAISAVRYYVPYYTITTSRARIFYIAARPGSQVSYSSTSHTYLRSYMPIQYVRYCTYSTVLRTYVVKWQHAICHHTNLRNSLRMSFENEFTVKNLQEQQFKKKK